jgi:polyisoprenoid-binding protein YceI
MKNNTVRFLFTVAVILLCVGSAAAQAETWTNDANHSGAYFQVVHLGINNVRGSFRKMNVTVQYDPKDISKTAIDATIDATTIDTDVEPRDKDLRSADYFDVEKFPTLTFKSKRVVPGGAGKLQLIGDLTIKGVTKEVTLDVQGPTAPVTDARKNSHMGAVATTKINRKDFGITANPVVSDEVLITLEMDLMKRPAPAAGSN